MINKVKLDIKNYLNTEFLNQFNTDINFVVEEPKRKDQGDLSIPSFLVAKALGLKLPEVVEKIKEALLNAPFSNIIESVNIMGGFVNISLSRVGLSKNIVDQLLAEEEIGKNDIFKGEVVCLDYSAPNIAKSFSIGHLRSTILGHAIANIFEKCSAKTVRINHLGDYGTQFGKLIYAYLNFSSEDKVKADPINELVRVYVLFHELAENDPTMDDKAREIFKELENGNPKYVEIWKWFREESLKEFMKMYDMLNVHFDSYNGESFYVDKMGPVVDELNEKELLVLDDGARIVKLDNDMPPAIIQKNDGSTLYFTRELAAVFYRKNTYNFTRCLYVVGNEQKLHFEQMRQVIDKMGHDFKDQIAHVNFGLVLQGGKKMSTRKGRAVKLIDVLNEAIQMSLNYINEKNSTLENKEEVAKKIGVSAVIFNDLKNYRANDFEFDLESMLKYEGQTGPYLQYTSVRINSILKESEIDYANIDYSLYAQDHYFDILKEISSYKSVLAKAAQEYAPSVLAKYLLNLAALFNTFYAKEKINVENELEKNTKKVLLYLVREVLNDGMKLLGMSIVEKM